MNSKNGATKAVRTVRAWTQRAGVEQMPRSAVRASDLPDFRQAVADGVLRSGIDGYWLPRAADPGALMVMRSAMTTTDEE